MRQIHSRDQAIPAQTNAIVIVPTTRNGITCINVQNVHLIVKIINSPYIVRALSDDAITPRAAGKNEAGISIMTNHVTRIKHVAIKATFSLRENSCFSIGA